MTTFEKVRDFKTRNPKAGIRATVTATGLAKSTVRYHLRNFPKGVQEKQPRIKLLCICGGIFECTEAESKYRKFCSPKCSVISKTKPPVVRRCPCGGEPVNKKRFCSNCLSKRTVERRLTLRIADVVKTLSASRAYYNEVRYLARKAMKEVYKKPKACSVSGCDFTAVLEVCHKKAISDFPEDALLSVVNAESNLIYLCPNHHALQHLGLLDISKF